MFYILNKKFNTMHFFGLISNLFMIKELFLIDFNSSTHYTYCRIINNKYKHEKEKTLDCYKRKSNLL